MGRAYEVRKASIMKNGAVKAKLYSNFAKEIYIAAKKGIPEMESNIDLKRIVDKAKRNEVPNDIINRAIEKAKGNSNDDYKTVIYEGFGPSASTLIIKCLTDNINRTVGEVRAAFNKIDKSLGVTNSVLYNYDYLATISFNYLKNEDELFEILLSQEIDIIDFTKTDGIITIIVNPKDYNELKDILEKNIENIEYIVDEIKYCAKNEIELSGEDFNQFIKLLKIIDNIEDVVEIYHNVGNC